MELSRLGGSSEYEMRASWSWSLNWYVESMESPMRPQQSEIVNNILIPLRRIDTIRNLHRNYNIRSNWILEIAKSLFPNEFHKLGIKALECTAYGVRSTEIYTGKQLDPRVTFPRWIGEFAVPTIN